MSGKDKSQQRPSVGGEETAGTSQQESTSNQKFKCFKDILDIVFDLSDEEWKCLAKDEPNMHNKMEFAALCTKIVISITKSTIKSHLPTLIDVLGMESFLLAEEKLKEKAESASKSPSATSSSSSCASFQRSPMDPSDFICETLDNFVSEAKEAMQKAICRVASGKPSSVSRDWTTNFRPVVHETLKILSAKYEHSHSVGTQTKTGPDTEAITGKIVMVVLDAMDGSSDGRRNLQQTSDLLIAAAERIERMVKSSNSEESLIDRTTSDGGIKQEVQPTHEEKQAKASRAVSQVLLRHSEVWKMNGSSSSLPISIASQVDLDMMLEAMAQSGFPPDSVFSHLESTSTGIVETIFENMDMLESPSQPCNSDHFSGSDTPKDSGFFSRVTNTMFHKINKKVKAFFKWTKQPEEFEAETPLSAKVFPQVTSPRIQVNIDGCTNEVIGKILELYKSEVLLAKPRSSEVSQSTGLCSNTSEITRSISAPLLKPSTVNMKGLKSEEFLTEAAQVVNDVLIKSTAPQISKSSQPGLDNSSRGTSSTSTISPVSLDSQHAAVNIAETIVDAMDRYIETMHSKMKNNKSSSGTLLSCLDAFSGISATESSKQSDSSEVETYSAPISLFRKVQSYLRHLYTNTSVTESKDVSDVTEKLSMTRSISGSEIAPLKKTSSAHLCKDQFNWNEDKINIDSCTDEVINKVVGLYRSELTDTFSMEDIQKLTSDHFHAKATIVVCEVLLRKAKSLPAVISSDFLKYSLIKDLHSSASEIAMSVAATLQEFLVTWKMSDSDKQSSSCIESSLASKTSVTPTSKEADVSEKVRLFAPLQLFMVVRRKLKNIFTELTGHSHQSNINTIAAQHENTAASLTDLISHGSLYKIEIASERPVDFTQSKVQTSSFATSPLENLISNDTTPCPGHRIENLVSNLLSKNITGSSHIGRHFSDSMLEKLWVRYNLLKDPSHLPSELASKFAEESIKHLLLNVLSYSPTPSNISGLSQEASHTFSDQDIQGSRASLMTQRSNSEKVFKNAVNNSAETREMNSEIIIDISGPASSSSNVSATHQSRVASALVNETLDHIRSYSQANMFRCCSPSPKNDQCDLDPVPVIKKKRRFDLRSIFGKKGFRFKKSNKVAPLDLTSDRLQSSSTSGNLEESLPREPKTSASSIRERFSRMFLAISKALPNVFCGMFRPL